MKILEIEYCNSCPYFECYFLDSKNFTLLCKKCTERTIKHYDVESEEYQNIIMNRDKVASITPPEWCPLPDKITD